MISATQRRLGESASRNDSIQSADCRPKTSHAQLVHVSPIRWSVRDSENCRANLGEDFTSPPGLPQTRPLRFLSALESRSEQ